MSYFIFLKDSDNVEGTLYRIAENQSDLNNLNISQTIYKIIEDSQSNFNLVKFGNKCVTKYSNNVITYVDQENLFRSKEQLKNHIDNLKNQIKQFTDNNPNHPLFSRWNNYYNQLNNLNLDSITYPLNKSLEQYFNDLGQPSYNILQLA
jgi:mRNA-degrading endonuclease YafQ of YafQ-DinJ toxin-antitoxin module